MKRPTVAVWAIVGIGLVWPAQAQASDGKQPVSPERILKKQIDRHAVKSSLAVALADFSVQTGIRLEVDWKALAAVGVERSTPVAVSVEKVTWHQVLDVILSRVQVRGNALAWYIEGERVLVSTQKQVLKMRARTARAVKTARGTARPKANSGPKVMKTVDFTDIPLKDVLKFFQTVLNANFHVNWKALEQAGVSPDTPITLKLKRISVGRAMDIAFDEVNATREKLDRIYWIVHRGVVLVSTGSDFNRTMLTRVIDAGTSLMVVPDSKGPRIDIQAAAENNPGGTGGGGESVNLFDDSDTNTSSRQDKSYDEQKKKQRENVIESIKSIIGKDMWKPEGKGSIRVIGNKLVITQSLLGFKLMEKSLR